jgi:hypothetical protein
LQETLRNYDDIQSQNQPTNYDDIFSGFGVDRPVWTNMTISLKKKLVSAQMEIFDPEYIKANSQYED